MAGVAAFALGLSQMVERSYVDCGFSDRREHFDDWWVA